MNNSSVMHRNQFLRYLNRTAADVVPLFTQFVYAYFNGKVSDTSGYLFYLCLLAIDFFHNLCVHAHNCFRLAKMTGVL